MSLEHILDHLKQIEADLSQYVEQQQYHEGYERSYMFMYEQKIPSKDHWISERHQIQAKNVEQAFCLFGKYLREREITARNISYFDGMKVVADFIGQWSKNIAESYKCHHEH